MVNLPSQSSANNKPAGSIRRIFALIYDSLLILAAIFVAFQPIPLLEDFIQEFPLTQVLTSIYLMAIWFLFLGWFWTHGGQTVGMKAWRIKLLRKDGAEITWIDATYRFILSNGTFILILMLVGLEVISARLGLILGGTIFCLSFLWAVIDQQGRAGHDALSRTQLIVLPSTKP